MQADNRIKELPCLETGSALHCKILETDSFDDKYTFWPGKIRAGKKYEEFKELNKGKTILKNKEYPEIQQLGDKFLATKIGSRINKCMNEFSIYDVKNNLKCRIDSYDKEENTIYDIKTIRDIYKTDHHMADYGYHVQTALYSNLLKDALGLENNPKFIFVFIDKSINHFFIRECDNVAVEYGNKVIERGMKIYKNGPLGISYDVMRLPKYYTDRFDKESSSDF